MGDVRAATVLKSYKLMTDAQVLQMLSAIGEPKSLHIEIYTHPMESVAEPLPNSVIFTRRCRIDNANGGAKIIEWISELKPVHPEVPKDKSALSMIVFGGYGTYDLKVRLMRGGRPVFSGVFTRLDENDKFSAGAFADNRVALFDAGPIRKIGHYIENPDVASHCVTKEP